MPEAITNGLSKVPASIWEMTGEMAPYLLLGFFVAGILSIFLSPEFIERHLGCGRIAGIIKASVLGVPLPLCSCGVIPVAVSLRRHGAGKGATTAFLISTPQTGIDSILVTYSLLGPVFAIFRPIIALVSGLIGGLAVTAVDRDERLDKAPDVCHAECCEPSGATGGRFARAMEYGFVTLVRDLVWPLTIGIIIAGAIAAFFGEGEALKPYLGDQMGVWAILIAMALGLPMYVCATASIPIAAAMLVAGASPGAALAFLMAGPVTNAASVATLWKLLGPRSAVTYLLTVAVLAVVAGLGLNWIFASPDVPPPGHGHDMVPLAIKYASAVALVLLMILSLLRRGRHAQGSRDHDEAPDGRELRTRLTVQGMTCGHCAETVRKALQACRGVARASVDVSAGRAVVDGSGLEADTLCRAVAAAGFRATEIHDDPSEGCECEAQ